MTSHSSTAWVVLTNCNRNTKSIQFNLFKQDENPEETFMHSFKWQPPKLGCKNKQWGKKTSNPKPTINESSLKNLSSMWVMSIVKHLGLYKNDKSNADD